MLYFMGYKMRETIKCARNESAVFKHGAFKDFALAGSSFGRLHRLRAMGETFVVSMLGITLYSIAHFAAAVYKGLFYSSPDGLALIHANHPVAAPYENLC